MFLSDVHFRSSSGSNKHIEYSSKVLKDGSIELVHAGVIDTDAMIESHRAGCELKNLLIRFQNGDLSALNQVNGFYADVTSAPTDMASALQYVMRAESIFNALSIDKKRNYDNDFRKWLSDFGSEDWVKVMNIEVKKPDAELEPIDKPIEKPIDKPIEKESESK